MLCLKFIQRMIGLAVLIGCISTVSFSAELPEETLPVRVSLTYGMSGANNATLLSDGGFRLSVEDYGEEPAVIDVNTLVLTATDGMLHVNTLFDETVAAVPLSEKIRISPVLPDTLITYGQKDYRGTLEVSLNAEGTLSVINELELEDYLRGVLPSEVYPSWPADALKTAAVAARTYALRSMLSSSHTKNGFDLCSTTHCQVYGGASKENKRTDAALADTAGLVLKYKGTLATTPYHSSSGGYTESASAAWGSSSKDYPYLASVFTPYEDYRNVPNGKWETIITPEELPTRIAAAYANRLTDGIADIQYTRADNGYIEHMTVTDGAGNTYSFNTSDRVRSFFGSSLVKSANFAIAEAYVPSEEVTPVITVISADGIHEKTVIDGYDYVTAKGVETTNGLQKVLVFDGNGYGHGVGLSQFGARCMADAGFTYEEILQTYFPGTSLEPLFSGTPDGTDIPDNEQE